MSHATHVKEFQLEITEGTQDLPVEHGTLHGAFLRDGKILIHAVVPADPTYRIQWRTFYVIQGEQVRPEGAFKHVGSVATEAGSVHVFME